ncbi:MAG TPA: MarR family winged helix-turn-helix transcriptional regulator [Gammaproteobacteria bacterium]|nr:MarR family winged helix-turn-helix transcriptional regulator [Gammaproteobacteria bacterium]
MDTDRPSKPMTLSHYRALADFRYELRRFLRYSEETTRRHGVTPLQYQVLLQVKGYPEGKEATVGGLAERLQAKHHGVVALVSRCEDARLVTRRISDQDRRAVVVDLTPKGERLVERLARLHRTELMSIQDRISFPGLKALE